MSPLSIEELHHRIYHMSNVLIDLCEQAGINNLDVFIVKHGISSEEFEKIDNIFFTLVDKNQYITFAEFKDRVNSIVEGHMADKVVKELLEVFKEYEPLGVKRVKM